jgi:elongin-A
LSRVTSPEQLRRIELASPQIRGEDAELWKAFIQRDVPNYKLKNYVPKNPLKWYEVYMRYKKEYMREIERDKERLREALLGIKKEKETHVSKVVDAKYLPKVPKDPRMLANDAGVPIEGRKRALAKPGVSSLSFASGPKTRMKDPASVLTRARREAKEISSRNKLGKPTHGLIAPTSQVLRAPRAMVDDYRKAAKPQLRIFATRKKPEGASNLQSPANGPSLEEREKKLRALTMTSRVTLVGSDSEDDSEDNLDDLVGEKKAASTSPPPKKPYLKQETQHTPNPASAKRPQTSRSLPGLKDLPAQASAEPKPSDLISSIISKSGPQQTRREQGSSQSKLSPPRLNTGTTTQGTSSPLRRPSPQPPQITKRKPAVDIFNRGGGAKRPRVR